MQLLCHYMIRLQQVVLAGVRELKPLYTPKIIDPSSYKRIGNNTSTNSLQRPLHRTTYTHTELSLLKRASKFVAHRNYLAYSFLTKLKFKQACRFMYIFTHHCAFH